MPAQRQLTEQEIAAQSARQQFLQQQHLFFFNAVRTLKVQLLLATTAGELAPETRRMIYGEMLSMASLCTEEEK